MKKIKIYVVCSELCQSFGTYADAKPFRSISEAMNYAESLSNEFIDEHGEDECETEREDEYSIYTFTDDYHIYITITEHEI